MHKGFLFSAMLLALFISLNTKGQTNFSNDPLKANL